MLETRWHLIRHAPVDNPEGRIYGASDKSANTSNANAFQKLAQRLPRKGIAITSHLRRTQQTLDALVSGGLEISEQIIENRLGEQDFGDWTGKTYEEVRSLFGDDYDKFWIAPAKEKPPNGENFIEVIDRVKECILECTQKFKGRDVICISHGGVIRAALTTALKIEAERALSFSVDNLSTTIIDYLHPCENFSGAWRVRCTNIPVIQEFH
tara:strand:+ start:3570 stop:4202 length:633 start_codon:yes stop_codon:yes gene_type:complete